MCRFLVYLNDEKTVQETLQKLQDKETELEVAFERWENLESKVQTNP